MPTKNRDYKNLSEGSYYHIYNRGNAKDTIFYDNEDYNFFLLRLRENLFPEFMDKTLRKPLPAGSFSLATYCLMPNHFHLLLKQCTELPISKLLLKICTSYSKYFNKKYNRVGQVFQDQFKAVLIETNEQLLWTSAYIHGNPTVAGLAQKLTDWRWTSFHEYAEKTPFHLCEQKIITKQFSSPAEYEKFVIDGITKTLEKKKVEHLLLDE